MKLKGSIHLTLSLFMLRISTDNKQNTFSFYDFALCADFFDRSPNFHNTTLWKLFIAMNDSSF